MQNWAVQRDKPSPPQEDPLLWTFLHAATILAGVVTGAVSDVILSFWSVVLGVLSAPEELGSIAVVGRRGLAGMLVGVLLGTWVGERLATRLFPR